VLPCFFFLVPFLSSKIDADVVFVHGLRGGPFMTWRQQEEKTAKKKDGTDCWPKVRGHVVISQNVCLFGEAKNKLAEKHNQTNNTHIIFDISKGCEGKVAKAAVSLHDYILMYCRFCLITTFFKKQLNDIWPNTLGKNQSSQRTRMQRAYPSQLLYSVIIADLCSNAV